MSRKSRQRRQQAKALGGSPMMGGTSSFLQHYYKRYDTYFAGNIDKYQVTTGPGVMSYPDLINRRINLSTAIKELSDEIYFLKNKEAKDCIDAVQERKRKWESLKSVPWSEETQDLGILLHS